MLANNFIPYQTCFICLSARTRICDAYSRLYKCSFTYLAILFSSSTLQSFKYNLLTSHAIYYVYLIIFLCFTVYCNFHSLARTSRMLYIGKYCTLISVHRWFRSKLANFGYLSFLFPPSLFILCLCCIVLHHICTYLKKNVCPIYSNTFVCKNQLCYSSEENVWKLCQDVATRHGSELQHCYVAFVSNSWRSVPLWRQRAGKDEDKLVVWVSWQDTKRKTHTHKQLENDC